MSLPRQILPGRFYELTRSCTQRQFLLRPDPEANQIFIYCLAEAAQRFGIEVILPSAMSNHHHTEFFDRHGTAIEFMQQFHKTTATVLNVHRGREENFWSNEPPCLLELLDRDVVMEKLVYAATNPVKDGLVERVRQWPGVNGLSALLDGTTIVVRRPRVFFRDDGPMPEVVELKLVIPPELGEADAVRRELAERVAAEEERFAVQRRHEGRTVVGTRAIRRQSWRASPTTPQPSRGIRPRFAARDFLRRIEAISAYRRFLVAYRRARAALLAGEPAEFPIGTYWLRRFANVPMATPKEN